MCRSHLSSVNENDFVIMSDRVKDLISIIRKNFSHAKHAFCVYHIKRNVKKKFEKKYVKFF